MDSDNMPPASATEKTLRALPWSAETRRWVVIGLILIAAYLVYQVREVVPPIVLALLVSYLLNPLVAFLERDRRMPRVLAVGLIYLVFVVLLVGASLWLVPILFKQLAASMAQLDQILARASAMLNQVPILNALGFQVDSASLADQLRMELTVLASAAPRVLLGAASGAFTALLVLVLSFYLLLEAKSIGESINHTVPAEYFDEWRRIKSEFGGIWSSFLRGQIILAIIIGVMVSTILVILGVPNALFLGLLAGVLEVVPNIGPIIAMIPAVLIAFFQGSTSWAIDNTTFALIVIAAYVVIQQLENHLIVPKVIGSSVNLPPVVILIGALAGANLAGVLGIFLAAPMLATGRLVGEFVLRKLLE